MAVQDTRRLVFSSRVELYTEGQGYRGIWAYRVVACRSYHQFQTSAFYYRYQSDPLSRYRVFHFCGLKVIQSNIVNKDFCGQTCICRAIGVIQGHMELLLFANKVRTSQIIRTDHWSCIHHHCVSQTTDCDCFPTVVAIQSASSHIRARGQELTLEFKCPGLSRSNRERVCGTKVQDHIVALLLRIQCDPVPSYWVFDFNACKVLQADVFNHNRSTQIRIGATISRIRHRHRE